MTLLDDIAACRLCQAHFDHIPSPVIQGSKKAKILIAGQAPSLTVHKTGKPFNDASGKKLRSWLGVTELQFYDPALFAIVPMAFCYPGRGKSGDKAPPKLCAKTWRETVLSEFNHIQLTVLIGQYAQAYHLDSFTNVTDTVRQWQSYMPTQIPIPHPSPRNHHWLKLNPWFEINAIPALKSRVSDILMS
ncbi:uracil-DNA glycosylase family protein [Pseudoalteromonas luteoviolacea]|uniref:Uracil-DNA glycosylase-like domain-containing protein n=1 Tax=Pseudoalteromonas luteoviolacea H33 TaxID=1365251 RepID=A0A167A757_9GAMM|nr:uracil-DNA glycosylase family protein [Pseudoalteromonas luteoviolacea]KZN45057.1 hypothetical protein N476_25735 [Pseudoalteromonas luteoviolacea H33]KZN79269.1 hypothetical protein N477_00280 [Pseudoalteromonas luteoviolacea H33-S]MBQ4877909.1 uracil-DNA glycosylase family protein [Pseudoalteromonas luteoviolacea]MBQ4906944.1 uracil-DNA glycosylase family protein [Pseudoalteromonas luteoviolacea]